MQCVSKHRISPLSTESDDKWIDQVFHEPLAIGMPYLFQTPERYEVVTSLGIIGNTPTCLAYRRSVFESSSEVLSLSRLYPKSVLI